MGLFGWISKGKTISAACDIEDDNVGFASDIIRIPSRDFFGHSRKSPNGRYTIAWLDGGPDQARRGRWIILDGGKVKAEGVLPRPNDGKVADNGTFILNDWRSIENLSGTFAGLLRATARPLFARSFKANLFNNGLSADGRWAVCQTANAPHEDGGRLFIFDLHTMTEIGAFQPESGWASDYRFSPDGQTILLGYQDGRRFAYKMDGTFLDRSTWLASGLRNGELFIIERILSEVDGKPSPLIELLLPAIDLALASDRYRDPRSQARGHRLRGACFDRNGDLAEAAASYERALALDSKVGVKRRLDQIRRSLAR
ncbi:conserved protein of unknown function [Bradyrhizobium vignae]|uniref:Tetratricopeptide repeat protein n=2 Tax=Bradyrhizobium vignae TaxID=1549949 RepID=A0A2U3Q8Y2_9BRAD|nr:conserved protein of unknown function [Bradyrhizobium vignae]